MAKRDKLIIFDTTLRDGEQSPGATMTADDKLRIALQLERLGVDVMEAGFAASSPGDFAAIEQIARVIRNSTVCSLARCNKSDIEKAGMAISMAPRRRIHTFIATSPLHMEKKLRMTPDQVMERAIEAVRFAKNYTDDIEFSCEDAYRSEPEFLYRICEAVIKEGATTINIPDTVGYAVPELYGEFMRDLLQKIPNSDKAVWSVHCHNDLGMAVANSLAGVKTGGARQVECTLNGLGERAGNCSLEEIVMAVKTRKDFFHLACDIDTHQIVPTSKLVSSITGFPVQPNKAIVGANAFAHASGIHQDGVLKARETYEIMTAEDVGWKANRIILGKLSGRTAFRQRVKELRIPVKNEEEINEAFARFKALADRKVEIFDEDIQALFDERYAESQDLVFVSLDQQSKTGEKPHAKIVYMENGVERHGEADGNGPVDATFNAIESCAKSNADLLLYSVNALTQGTQAQGEVTVRLSFGGRIVNGNGADPDILAASAKAYLDALNKLHLIKDRTNPQLGEETGV